MKTRILFAAFVTMFTLLVAARDAFADTRTTFAVIVTSNRSPRLSRPDLHYADDDGAKYYELFRMLAPEANLALLTSFDSDTKKLFPHLVGKELSPTRGALASIARDFAEKVRRAKLGGQVDFYFVFDIDNGKGFLELEDGPFTSDDLEAMLKAEGATRAHVILDSCNSFFVVNARKPGGRHFVTSEEATRSLTERFPNVGVFLSTSAEAAVYEWSELQSGVFSHAVRSGLSGAADADGDGHVSYDELRAFVSIATKDVKNPNYRPQVFARGPAGNGAEPLFDLGGSGGVRLRVGDAHRRLTLRDANEVPWLDLHKEVGPLGLVVPRRIASEAALEDLDPSGMVTKRVAIHATDEAEIELALLESSARAAARGKDEMFRSLFAHPFGPIAFASYHADDEDAEPQVLGVSADERERLRLMLVESADDARRRRIFSGFMLSGLTLASGALGATVLADSIPKHDTGNIIGGGVILGATAFLGTMAASNFFSSRDEEVTLADFRASLSLDPNTLEAQRRYATAEARLLKAAEADRRKRSWTRWVGLGMMVGPAVLLAGDLATQYSQVSPDNVLVFGTTSLIGGAIFVDSFFPTATERMAGVWKQEPGNRRFTLAPYFTGLGGGLKGSF